MPEKVKRLYKSRDNKILFGVCGGIGDYFGIDPIIVRLIWLMCFLCLGSGLLIYLIAALIIPKSPVIPI